MIATDNKGKDPIMVTLTKDPDRIAAAATLKSIRERKAGWKGINIISTDDWQQNPPLIRDRGGIELATGYEQCPQGHGMRRVKAYHRSSGFGAGYVYFMNLECGHQITDDQSYPEV